MRYTFTERPNDITRLNNGKYRIFYNIEESQETITIYNEDGTVKEEITQTVYLCDGTDEKTDLTEVSYKNVVNAIIRVEYELCDELAILRQKDTKVEDYNTYYAWAEYAKERAQAILPL